MTRFGETEADDLFRADAERLGYLHPEKFLDDEGEVIIGAGLWAYYTERGMVPPGKEKAIATREVTGLDLERPIPDDE